MMSRLCLFSTTVALTLMPIATLAEDPKPQEILRPQEMRVLPGQLDNVLVFNSNSPELVLEEGILLSSFPSAGKQTPQAHLARTFSGRFDIFTHHIAKGSATDLRTLYHAVVAYNPQFSASLGDRGVAGRELSPVSPMHHLSTWPPPQWITIAATSMRDPDRAVLATFCEECDRTFFPHRLSSRPVKVA